MLNTSGDAAAVSEADQLDRVWPTGHSLITPSFWERPAPSAFFHGPAGMLDWMRKFWANDAGSETEWDSYAGAPLAILESDAITLFPELFDHAPPEGVTAAGQVLTLVQSDGQAGTDVQLRPSKKPDELWKDSDYKTLLDQFKALQGKRVKAAAAHQMLAEAWGYKPNSIKQFLTTARGLPMAVGRSVHRA